MKKPKVEERVQEPGTEPRRRNAEASRKRLLTAGMTHFSRYGLGGARVTAIIAEAQMSHRMLYHYYESKEQLYVATLEFAYEQIRLSELALHIAEMAPVDGIRRLVEFTFDYYVEEPEFMALLSQENLNGGAYISASERIRALQSPLLETLTALSDRGVADGSFAEPLDPLNLYIDIAGLCYFALSNRLTLAAVFDPRVAKPAFLKERKQHVVRFVTAALTNLARRDAAPGSASKASPARKRRTN
jgi:AcrR family transcriptional regulator